MIAEAFFLFAIALLILRIAKYDDFGTHWVASDILSALFMFIAFYFFVFVPTATASSTTLIANVPACTSASCTSVLETINTTASSSHPEVTVNSNGFILLITLTIFYVIIMVIFALRDFILRRSSFKG